jgi:hypothetical protein
MDKYITKRARRSDEGIEGDSGNLPSSAPTTSTESTLAISTDSAEPARLLESKSAISMESAEPTKTLESTSEISAEFTAVSTASEALSSGTTSGIINRHSIILPDTPNQPSAATIAPQTLSNKILRFQDHWFNRHPWLHYDDTIKGVLCICCAKAWQLQLIDFSKLAEATFMYQGFRNWKKALEKFKAHELSSFHQHAMEQARSQKRRCL